MKKLFFIPLVGLFFLTSCIYSPVNRSFKIRDKGLSKDYSGLNNPVIFTLTATQEFSKGKKITKEDFGSVHLIYDWENNEINDYFFTKTYNSVYNNSSFIDIKNSDGTKTYLNIDLSTEIMKINLKQPVLTTKKFDDDISYLYRWVKPSVESGKYAVLFYKNSYNVETCLYDCTFCIFSEDENNYIKIPYKNIESAYDIFTVLDASGNTVWFNEIKSADKKIDTKLLIKTLDLETQTISEPFVSFDAYSISYDENSDYKIEKEYSYYVMFADSSYLLLNKMSYDYDSFENENSIVMINLSTKEQKEINLDKDKYVEYVAYLNNQYYVFARKLYENYFVYTIDYLTGNKTLVNEYSIKGKDIDSYFIRDDSIYFIDYEKNHSYISRFDAKSNKYEDLLTAKVSDLIY